MRHTVPLRPAQPADLPALRALHRANWRRDDAARRRGIALAHTGAVATDAGARPVSLDELGGNAAALVLYRRRGGEVRASRPVPFLGCQVAERVVTWPCAHNLAHALAERAA